MTCFGNRGLVLFYIQSLTWIMEQLCKVDSFFSLCSFVGLRGIVLAYFSLFDVYPCNELQYLSSFQLCIGKLSKQDSFLLHATGSLVLSVAPFCSLCNKNFFFSNIEFRIICGVPDNLLLICNNLFVFPYLCCKEILDLCLCLFHSSPTFLVLPLQSCVS